MNQLSRKIIFITVMALALVFIYWPALTGGFILDDFKNLGLLSYVADDVSIENVRHYLSEQKSGVLGRPISSLSFLWDATNWPVDSARPFKTTNLFLHIINSILLFFLLSNIFNLYKDLRLNRLWLAFVCSMFWAIHPFFISTTMYVVQRMAMLATTFSLLGMLMFIKGRCHLQISGGKNKALLYMFTGAWVCTLLAVLSKENGVLLLVFILLLEKMILQPQLEKTMSRRLVWLILLGPILVVILALIYKFPEHVNFFDMRHYSMFERLLTESRILMKYLYYLIVPDYLTEGVFGDGILPSRGLFKPITTFYSVVTIGLLLLCAWLSRRKIPLLSFSIIFYFAAHLLESTYLPLELYYEHRNYMAAIFIFIPVVLLLNHLRIQPKLYYTLPVIFLIFLGFIGYLRSNLWGNNLALHYQTAMKFPESARATNTTASLYAWDGDYENAVNMLNYGIKNHERIQLRLNKVAILCELNRLEEKDLDQLLIDMNSITFVKDDLAAMRDFLHNLLKKDCYKQSAKERVVDYLGAFEKNHLFKTSSIARKFFYYQNASIKASLGDLEASLNSFKQIIHEVKNIGDDPLFESTAYFAIDFLKEKDKQSAIDLAAYYQEYCLQNFSDCDTIFIKELESKITTIQNDISNNSSQK